jgi:DHA1 family bicyclomycin/chloramphenicol resistance-like MFS transporter
MMALLIAMTALAPLSLQIFLPALPAIQTGFGVSTGIAQLTLSLSILANAFATLAYGPLSDRFGRRPVLLGGLFAFVGGSLVCAVAPTITTLIIARIVQSMGGAAGMVLSRAIVRDLHDREQSARVIAYLTTAMVVAPMVSPMIGAVLIDLFGWRSIFVAVTAGGAALTLLVLRHLVETHPPDPDGGSPRMFAGATRLVRAPAFAAYVLQSTFAIAVFFAFISGAPYFMIDVLGRSATEYGIWFMVVSAGFMAGNLVAARITHRVGIDRMILIGSVLACLAVAVAAGLLFGGRWWPAALFGPMVAGAFANGLTVPNAQAGAVSVDPMLAGTASGFAGFSQMFFAALVAQAVGVLQDGTPYPMVVFMLGAAALSLAGFVLPRRLDRPPM